MMPVYPDDFAKRNNYSLNSYTYEDYIKDFELDYLGFDGVPDKPTAELRLAKNRDNRSPDDSKIFSRNGCPGKETVMKEMVNITEYANLITKALPKGILLNTKGDKFNTMVIGWGHLGTLWSLPTFHVYVRKGRYTRSQLDKTTEFTISVPLENADPNINRICGSMSGHNIDKVKEAGLTLVDSEVNHTPGIQEYPLTIECNVLYAQALDLAKIPQDLRDRYYPQDVPSTGTGSNCDTHIMYVGQIVAAYIIK